MFLRNKDNNIDNKELNYTLIHKIQPQGGIKFLDKYIKLGTGYVAVIEIYDYPTYLNDHWLIDLTNFKNAITTIDMTTEDVLTVKQNINKSLSEQESRFYMSKDKIEEREAKQRYQELDNLFNEVSSLGEITKKVHIRIFVSAGTYEDIEKESNIILKTLESNGFRGTIYLNENKEQYKSLFSSFSEQDTYINKRYGQPLTTSTLAGGNPFHFTTLKDPNGSYLGYTSDTGGAVCFDHFTVNKFRKSYDMIVLGNMGTGKSTVLKKLMVDRAVRGDMIRGFEVDGGFINLIKSLGGQIVSLDGTDGIINPFQILQTESSNDINFAKHMQKLNLMYQFLAETNDREELVLFDKVCRDLYKQFNFFKNDKLIDIGNFKNEDFPTLSSLYKHLNDLLVDSNIQKANEVKMDEFRLYNKIKLTIENLVQNYGHIFDGYTSIKDIFNEQILFFDVRKLKDMKNNIFTFQIFNALNLLWDNCLKNGKEMLRAYTDGEISLSDITRFSIFMDEAHKIINTSNLVAVRKIVEFKREARKYFGSFIFATQSIRDIVPEGSNENGINEIKLLFELSQYKIIYQQSQSVLDILNRVFQNQINTTELSKIPTLERGQCILYTGENNVTLNVELSQEENTLFGGGV